MGFVIRDKNGNQLRGIHGIDCSDDPVITEQHHKTEVDINNIIRKYGPSLIAQTSMLAGRDFQFDDVTNNDFQEAMFKVTKAQQTFDQMPADIRKRFDNNPGKFLDFIHDPKNVDEMVSLGLATKREPPQPVEVVITNPETPPS